MHRKDVSLLRIRRYQRVEGLFVLIEMMSLLAHYFFEKIHVLLNYGGGTRSPLYYFRTGNCAYVLKVV